MTRSPSPAAGYDDAQALNDIHALLASASRPASVDVLVDVASILACAGRPPWPRRILTGVAEDDAHGVPAARIDADLTQVLVMPKGPGLLNHVIPRDQVNAEAPEISLADTVIRQPQPHGGRL